MPVLWDRQIPSMLLLRFCVVRSFIGVRRCAPASGGRTVTSAFRRRLRSGPAGTAPRRSGPRRSSCREHRGRFLVFSFFCTIFRQHREPSPMLIPEISGGDNSISPVHALSRTAGPISSGHRGRRAINERPYGGVRRADEGIRPYGGKRPVQVVGRHMCPARSTGGLRRPSISHGMPE